ncbi:MAG: hypothetical protein H6722_21195 [Sandaracinus sp.]|nr:hypothetical protein [Sandaracinus sp.]MCB9618549.1 hypothetical protein [Sandaracinus sp.]MCB9622111.1 hypothetical protein [Sandaracinus sp.]
MKLSTIEFRVEPSRRVQWDARSGFQPVTLYVDGEDFVETIRRIEVPYVAEERALQEAEDGELDDVMEEMFADVPGRYLNLSASETFLPRRNFLGAPYDTGFELAADDPFRAKSLLLQCACGITECWMLMARIEVHDDVVTWTDVGQFHRQGWNYDLSFAFEREAYEAALRGPA